LLKLGIDIGQRSVSKYMVRCRKPPSQTWRTFLENHAQQLVSIDFFTVPTIRFQVLYVFLVLAHDRRRILHFNVTAHPTADWTGQQLREAFPFAQLPRYLLRDRDAIFGDDFREHVRDMGICEVLSAPRAPWQRAYIERVIGSVRRECLDHMIVFHETSLRRTLTSYFDYYSPIENASFAGEGRTGATSDSPARNGIRRSATPRRRTAPPLRPTGCLNEPESTLPVLAFRLSSPKSARAQGNITANLVHQIQRGSASPSTFAVHLEEYLRPLGCSEFPGGTICVLCLRHRDDGCFFTYFPGRSSKKTDSDDRRQGSVQ